MKKNQKRNNKKHLSNWDARNDKEIATQSETVKELIDRLDLLATRKRSFEQSLHRVNLQVDDLLIEFRRIAANLGEEEARMLLIHVSYSEACHFRRYR